MKLKIKIPESWEEITLENYQRIFNLPETNLSEYDSAINYLHLLLNIEKDILTSIDEKELLKLLDTDLKWLFKEPPIKKSKEINFSGETYTYNDNFFSITFGEMISFETLIEKNNCNYLDSMGYVLGLLLRKKDLMGYLLGLLLRKKNNKIIEIFDPGKIEIYKNKFIKLPVTDCLNIITSFFEWRKKILEQYKNLFKDETTNEDNEPSNEPSISNNFKWLCLVDKLAQSDITKFNDIYRQNYISCLNLLSYWKEKEEYIARIQRRQELRNKSKKYF